MMQAIRPMAISIQRHDEVLWVLRPKWIYWVKPEVAKELWLKGKAEYVEIAPSRRKRGRG